MKKTSDKEVLPKEERPAVPPAAPNRIARVRLARLEVIAVYEAEDADGDSVGPPIRIGGKDGQPIIASGKEIDVLGQRLRAQIPDLFRRLTTPPTVLDQPA